MKMKLVLLVLIHVIVEKSALKLYTPLIIALSMYTFRTFSDY